MDEIRKHCHSSAAIVSDLICGCASLFHPGYLVLMLNIDWFQPFEHTQYSIGVIYFVIQNLPRSMRFRPENIIVSTIPEPSCDDLNPYLTPMVDDLLRLFEVHKFRLYR